MWGIGDDGVDLTNLTSNYLPRVSTDKLKFVDSGVEDNGTSVRVLGRRLDAMGDRSTVGPQGVFGGPNASNAGIIAFARGSDGATASLIGYPTATDTQEIRTTSAGGAGSFLSWYTRETSTATEKMRLSSVGGLSVGTATDAPAGSLLLTAGATINSTETVPSGRYSKTSTTTVANTTTETSLWGAAQTIPAGRIATAGTAIMVRAHGRLTCAAGAVLTVKVKVGTTVIGTAVAATLVSALTGVPFRIEGDLTFRTVGASGTVWGYVMMTYGASSSATSAVSVIPVCLSTADTTWATNAAQSLDITATWGAASASNSISCDGGKLMIC